METRQQTDIDIVPLSRIPHCAPILAHWSYVQWYRNRPIEFKVVLAAYQARAQSLTIPLTLVALVRGLPVGMVSLKLDDLWSRRDLNPWLASLYVHPLYRHQGIASQLMKRLVSEASAQGIHRLHLFIGGEEYDLLHRYYLDRGWQHLDYAIDNDQHPTEIFSLDLAPHGK